MHGNTKLKPEYLEIIRNLYVVEKKPLSEIGLVFNVSLVTVRNFMVKNEIPIRALSDANKLSRNRIDVKEKRRLSVAGKPSGALGKKWKVEDTSNYAKKAEANGNWKGGIATIPELAKARRQHYKAKRRAGNRCPVWADKEKIAEMYKEASRMGLSVDHIVPLCGKAVSGLHVENNLQLLSKRENSQKGNRFNG